MAGSMELNRIGFRVLFLIAMALPGFAAEYAVVVSRRTMDDAGWKGVADALVAKHRASVVIYDGEVAEVLPELKRQFPRYVCFVAQPGEAGRRFVEQVHQATRRLDDDPYTDCFWGILTGYDAANALRIARCDSPLTIHKAVGGTEIALQCCDEGVWYSESRQGCMVRKEKGREPQATNCSPDTTKELVTSLTEYKADLFVTSGHATERDWQIGYSYRNGQFRCEKGELFGLDMKGARYPVRSPNPKVYLAVGNCLMGHIDGPDAMALAFLNSGGVNQMIGYTVATWYGYAGWGCLAYFLEQPGRYSLTEAFFANHAALIHLLQLPDLSSEDKQGLLYDRDTVAFYGDPAWEARMAGHDTAWEQKLTEHKGEYTLEIRPKRGVESFNAVNGNGARRGGRPIVQFLRHRVRNIELVEGMEFAPVVTDNFVLIPNIPGRELRGACRVRFRADRI